MYYEEETGHARFLAGLLIGAVLGASIALLTAPESGEATRHRITRVLSDRTLRSLRGDEDDEAAPVRGRRRRVAR